MSYDSRSFDHGQGHGQHDGAGSRARGRRSVTDYGSTVLHWMHGCLPRYKGSFKGEFERPSASYIIDFLPPSARVTAPADSVPVKHLHSSLNKVKHPVNIVRWTPEGRRLLTASTSGEFTLWNGTGFNFETIMQAHDSAIRALEYSHSDDWLLSGDHDGIIKYWQPNFNNVQSIHGHNDPIRDIAFSPTDAKFVTASDDSTLKIFDFAGGVEETTLTGHGWDAKSCDWHPTKGLLVSGSKDHLVKLWDPRTGRCLTTLHGHKNTITKTLFERVRGQCLATSARDQVARVLDLRMMRDICLLKGYDKDVTKDITTLTWHPIHPSLLSTGGMDGSMMHYILDEPNTPPDHRPSIAPYDSPDPTTCPAQVVFPAHRVKHAHDMAIWSLHWHPLGHILASGSNDRITRFWARARPGDTDWARDRYHIGEAAAEVQGTWDRRGHRRMRLEEEEQEMEDEMEGLVDQKMPIKRPASQVPGIPGLPLQGRPPPPSRLPPPPLGSIMPGASTLPPHPSLPLPLPLSLPLPPLPFALPGLSNGSVPQLPPPPLPAFDPTKPPNLSLIAELMQKAGLPLPPPGLLPPPPSLSFPLPSLQDVDRERERRSEAGRRRAPLPTQEESLRLEQSRGHFTRAR